MVEKQYIREQLVQLGYKDFNVFRPMGSGGERPCIEVRVIKATRKSDETKVVLRIVANIEGDHLEHAHLNSVFESEHAIAEEIKKIAHPNIVKINNIQLSEDGKLLIIEMPRYKCDLRKLLCKSKDRNEFLPLEFVYKIGFQLARALVFLREHQMIHIDITLNNMLVEEFDLVRGVIVIVLADFEKSFKFDSHEQIRELSETGQASAPKDGISPAYDIWSLGVMLYQLITGDTDTLINTLNDDQLRLLLFGTDSKNNIVNEDDKNVNRLKESRLNLLLWNCFRESKERIPALSSMEEILMQFFVTIPFVIFFRMSPALT